METLNINLLLRALNNRKRDLLLSRAKYESELADYYIDTHYNKTTEKYKMLNETISNITDELIEIIEQEEALERLK